MKLLICLLLVLWTTNVEALDLKIYSNEIPSYWVSYAKMYNVLNTDRQQTLQISKRKDLIEMNPLLGNKPNSFKINTYFVTSIILPIIIANQSSQLKTFLAESITYTEELMTSDNTRTIKDVSYNGSWPIGLRMQWRF